MPRRRSPTADKERSPLRQPHLSPATPISGNLVDAPSPSQLVQSTYPIHGEIPTLPLPTYSETILQRSIVAVDHSTLPPQTSIPEPSSTASRRHSSGSMRRASITFEPITPTSTPTGRISKAKKGKRVHACEFPGCGKVFTRAEHRRRHELNHNPEAVFRCPLPGCGKSFHRMDLLQRHQERHELEASPSLTHSTPHHADVFASPPLSLPSGILQNPSQEAPPRTSSAGLSIGSLVHPPYSQHNVVDTSLVGLFMPSYNHTVDPYFYGSDGSHSPISDNHGGYHHHPSSSASSVAGYDPSSISPRMTASMPGAWVPATSAPPIVLPSTIFEEGQTSYIPSPTVNSMPILRELDGHEFAQIQRELSTVPRLIFDSTRPEIPKYIRSDCLEHYWKNFHPSFPIVYKPNFLTNKPPPLLLSAVLAIGSFYDSRPDAKLYSLALQEIATKLLRQRGEPMQSKNRIADLQTVILLEILSKYSARHATPETSARFRALFASLHQARVLLLQNPLAVYKTLKAERTDEDLKRAHKFWLEHEARRRIFHACSVLDAQQVALFEQRPTIVTHNYLTTGAASTAGTIYLPCEEDLWEASPLDEWAAKAETSVPRNLKAARDDYQSASISDYSFFQHQIITANADGNLRCAEEMSSPPRRGAALSNTRFNYHVFQMAKHTPVRSLLVVVGESWFLGRKIEQETEYDEAKITTRDWIMQATSPRTSPEAATSLKAHWHALKVLRAITPCGDSSFQSTNMLHEDWSIYLAALVCWAHGYGRSAQPQILASQDLTPASLASSKPRKRKATEVTSPSRKKQAKAPATGSMSAPSTAAYTTQASLGASMFTAANVVWSSHGPVANYGSQHPAQAYYNTPLPGYLGTPSDTTTSTAQPSVYATSIASNSSHTATNTLHPQPNLAASVFPIAVLGTEYPLNEFNDYLLSTDVPAEQDLGKLDRNILARTRGVFDAVRIYKIGAKGTVGGLMNDAERVLSRLAEAQNGDMF